MKIDLDQLLPHLLAVASASDEAKDYVDSVLKSHGTTYDAEVLNQYKAKIDSLSRELVLLLSILEEGNDIILSDQTEANVRKVLRQEFNNTKTNWLHRAYGEGYFKRCPTKQLVAEVLVEVVSERGHPVLDIWNKYASGV